MIVLVCGGRDFSDRQTMVTLLSKIEKHVGGFDMLIHGAAKGADVMAGDWGCCLGIPVRRFEAEWSKYGKSAGGRRNARMLDEGHPDLVVAFPTGRLADSRGTRDMVTKAVNARVPVMVVVDGQVLTHDGHPYGI